MVDYCPEIKLSVICFTATETTIYQKYQLFFGKMTVDTIQPAVDEVVLLGGLNDAKRLDILIRAIIAQAINNPRMAPMYVDLFDKTIKRICVRQVDQKGAQYSFVKNCDLLFDEKVKNLEKFSSPNNRSKCLGLMRLLGILFLYDILPHNTADSLTVKLVADGNPAKMECFYEFSTVMRMSYNGLVIRPSYHLRTQLGVIRTKLICSKLDLDPMLKGRFIELANCSLHYKRPLYLDQFDGKALNILHKFAIDHDYEEPPNLAVSNYNSVLKTLASDSFTNFCCSLQRVSLVNRMMSVCLSQTYKYKQNRKNSYIWSRQTVSSTKSLLI